jgi:hypothetical protein
LNWRILFKNADLKMIGLFASTEERYASFISKGSVLFSTANGTSRRFAAPHNLAAMGGTADFAARAARL